MGTGVTTPVDQGFMALAELERHMANEEVIIRRRGFLRGRIFIETRNGEVLCEILPSAILKTFHHETTGQVFNVPFSVAATGFFTRTVTLRVGDTSLLSMQKRIFSNYLLLVDREGRTRHVRLKGMPWKRRFELTEAPGRALFRLRALSLFYKLSVSAAGESELPRGTAAGLAVLFYYNRYLLVRFMLLSGGGQSSH